MIVERGTFTTYTDTTRPGILMRNEDGVDWHHYVLSRVIFTEGGRVNTLFEHGSMTETVEGDRFFVQVINGVVNFVVNRDLSALEPRDSLVVETDQMVEAGMLYDGGLFAAAPPPPPLPPEPAKIDKVTFFDNFTDAEFELWDEKFPSASARQRTLWNNGTVFYSDQPSWVHIQALMIHVFGQKEGLLKAPNHPAS